MSQLQNGSIKLPPSVTNISWVSFTTVEGGFGVAYSALNSTILSSTDPGDMVTPVWFTYIMFLDPDASKFGQPLLIYEAPVATNTLTMKFCHFRSDGSGYSCIFFQTDQAAKKTA